MEKSLAFILAGGAGERLRPLTNFRAKPAVPFSRYRILDHNTSAIINAGIKTILFPIQYEQRSLLEHIINAYSMFRGERKIIPIPPNQRINDNKKVEIVEYLGTADAVFQNIREIKIYNKPEEVLVFSADHITDINVGEMIKYHRKIKPDLTIAAEVRKIKEEDFELRDNSLHYKYGIILTKDNEVIGFREKPSKEEMAGIGDKVLVSMGNYIFNSKSLIEALENNFGVDFGKHVIPAMLNSSKKIFVYKFRGSEDIDEEIPIFYWRDVGDINSFFDTCLELNNPNPRLDYQRLIEENRPVISTGGIIAPSRIESQGKISTISEGCRIYGKLENCVLGQNVFIGHGSYLKNTIVFPNVRIEPGVNIQNAIIDKNNIIPSGITIGYNKEGDILKSVIPDPHKNKILLYTIIPKGDEYITVIPRVDPN